MDHDAPPPRRAESSVAPGVLPSNRDDPRFAAADSGAAPPAAWTTGSALQAELLEPLDEARTALTSPVGLVELALKALVWLVRALLEHHGL
jgi:hypothetical protein